MIDLTDLWPILAETPLADDTESLRRLSEQRLALTAHGDMPRWQGTLEQLPTVPVTGLHLDRDSVTVGSTVDDALRVRIEAGLRDYHPWRKGPYAIHGVHIDTEWRSDLKWARLKDHIQPLEGRLVLDVGCGNGYHCWRMAGEGARLVIGIDPTLLYVMQFYAIKHFLGPLPVYLLPVTLEEMPQERRLFDTVFSMGVLYHRRSPFEHLAELRGMLRPEGELILETLVIEGDAQSVLVPDGRYAKMKNVWFLPSPEALLVWLKRAGFHDAQIIDVTPTTSEEQRRTEWMHFESLSDFLDPDNLSMTVEGHPAPRRAIVLAKA